MYKYVKKIINACGCIDIKIVVLLFFAIAVSFLCMVQKPAL